MLALGIFCFTTFYSPYSMVSSWDSWRDKTELSVSSDTDHAATTLVAVSVVGTRSSKGFVLALLFAAEDGFPDKPERAIAQAKAPISEGQAELVFSGIRPGNYAISIIHDENNNGKLDMNFLGIPKEGVGASNNSKKRMGPPRFEDAKFIANQPAVRKRIALMYL